MRRVILFLWGALIASGWWLFGILKYLSHLNGNYPGWFFPIFVILFFASLISAVVIVRDICCAIEKCWND